MDVPWIFLSHSGKQKDFTRQLYHELKRAGHHPFFDQDADRSLPKGHAFPPRIIDACRGCKMGIVVLSDEYMDSMWPMVELEQFCFHNPSIFIYPLFYRLQPADLSSAEKLTQWQSRWDSRAHIWPARCADSMSSSQCPRIGIDIDMSSWPEAVRILKNRNGDVLPKGMADNVWIKTIVSNICKTLPPPQRYLLSDHIKGCGRMQSNIDKLYDGLPHQVNGVVPLGVHGKGGSGKTTLCKTMANFYNKDFPGRSILIEFPSEDNKKWLLDALKNTLSILMHTKEEELIRLCNIEEAMSQLEDFLKRHRAFLAIDNIWHWSLVHARQIIEMKYVAGSKVMVTSRSKKVLECCMSPNSIVQVPNISEEEAIEVLISYSRERSWLHTSKECLESLAEFLVVVEECHPSFLARIGTSLGQVHKDHTFVDYKSLVSTYAEGCCLHAVQDIAQLLVGLSSLFVARHFEPLKNDLNQLQAELNESKDEIEANLDKLEGTLDEFEEEMESRIDQLEDKIELHVEQFKSKVKSKLNTKFNSLLNALFDD